MATGAQTVKNMEGHWHKLLLIVMYKHDIPHTAIGEADLNAIPAGSAIVVQEGRDGDGLLHLSLVDPTTAAALTSKYAGGTVRGGA